MAQPVLKTVTTSPGIKERLLGATQALKWARQAEPPSDPTRAGVYVAALERAQAENRAVLGRALLHCDLRTRSFRPALQEAYRAAAAAYPEDERCQFYLAALSVHGLLEADPAEHRRQLSRLLNPAWRKSALWSRLQIQRDRALEAMDGSSGDAADVMLLEGAFRAAPERSEERLQIGRQLAALYRFQGRTDDNSISLARYLMTRDSNDRENIAFLADHLERTKSTDEDAVLVFERALFLAQDAGDVPAQERWTRRLVGLYLEQERVGAETFPVFFAGRKLFPKDTLVEAAVAYTAALSEARWGEPGVLLLLAQAVTREDELRPLFLARRWRWDLVVRALALLFGANGRNDEVAQTLYAHAVDLCPEDRDVWGYHAASLAQRRDTSPEALHAYERVYASQRSTDLTLAMLGHAYLVGRQQIGPHRAKVMGVWQELYRKGLAGPELTTALGEALAEIGDVGELGAQVWSGIAAREPQNGRVRRHLGMSLLTRGSDSEALIWLREAAALLPNDHELQRICARLIVDNGGDPQEAVALMGRLVHTPEGVDDVEAHVLLGRAYVAADRRDDAKVIFRKVVEELDPGNTQSILMLARLNLRYEQEGVATAEMLYARALEQEPDNPETYRRLADLYHDEGETRLEQAALERYLSLIAGNAEQYGQLADMYVRRRDWERAENALRQVVTLGGATKKTYSLLGEVLHARNRAA